MWKAVAVLLVLLGAPGAGYTDAASPDYVQRVGAASFDGRAHSASAAADDRGLATAIGSYAVEVADNKVFLGSGNRIAIYTVEPSGPPSLTAVSESLPATVQDIAWHQEHAFVAYAPRSYESGGTGVHVLNVVDPWHPSVVAELPRPAQVHDLEMRGQFLLMAGAREPANEIDGPRGVVEVIDIADSGNPSVVATVTYSHPIVELEVVGQTAVCIEERSGAYANALRTLDLADPHHPRRVHTLNLADSPTLAAIDGSSVYLARGWASLQSVRLGRDGQNPVLSQRISRAWRFGDVAGLAVDPRHLLAMSSFTAPGVRIVDLSALPQPRQIGFAKLNSEADEVEWNSDRLYIAGGRGGGLHVVGVTDPANPALLYTLPPPADQTPPPSNGTAPSTRTPLPQPSATATHVRAFELYLPDVRAFPPPIAAQIELADVGHLGGATRDVALSADGEVLYRAEGPSLVALDVTEPSSVRELGRTRPLGGVILGAAIEDNTAYVAAGEAGLHVVDVRAPTSPIEVGRLRLAGTARSVAVEEAVAYVAADDAGLILIDVRDPRAPREISRVMLPGRAWAVAIAGGTAYVALADASPSIRAIDFADRSSPAAVAAFGTSDIGAVDLQVGDDNVTLVALERTRQTTIATVFDVSDPANPSEGKPVEGADAMALTGDSLVLVSTDESAYDTSWLTTHDLSDPSAPEGGAPVEVRGQCRALAAGGSHAFAACGYAPVLSTGDAPADIGWLHSFIDVDGPAPQLVGTHLGALGYDDPFATGDSFAIASGCVWVVYDDNAIVALDVSDPTLPRPSAHISGFPEFTDIEVVGKTAFAVADRQLLVLDVTDPFSPEELGECSYEGRYPSLSLGAGHAFVVATYYDADLQSTGSWFHNIDTSDPAHPHLVGSVDLAGSASGLTSGERYAYTVSGARNTLLVIDASQETEPTVVAEIESEVAHHGSQLAVQGERLYVVSVAGLASYSLADTAYPRPVGNWGPAAYGADIWSEDLSATVIDGLLVVGGIDTAVYDTTTDSDLVPIAQFGAPPQYPYHTMTKGRLAVVAGHIYATYAYELEWPYGLMVLAITR